VGKGERKGRQGKVFFFEKKKQKTFVTFGWSMWRLRAKVPKVFWFFFSKKNFFLPGLPSHSLVHRTAQRPAAAI
jgi:hypothetical protein